MKILLVDDSRTMRNIQRNVLAQLGHEEIIEAADGEEAIRIAEAESPELILLDWNMPKMDGLTFLRMFRARNKTTPIIMVTTESEKGRVIEAIKAGVSNYVIKPFTPEILRTRITETLEKKAA